ncbi:CaiB/BaiF CoA transferase family protein [Chelatococcus asaccharovorans]|uniref:CaiB/BaiF CoA transferase family protein n=1 Tax=Chelatococcus asaccharovorans TaxID=28210 RepID=UPI00224C67D2|nr:CoA transferase [Chelatococcus asaccharovorans]CAH1663441.1 Crotonobetainyl-CoA:carnitine CoA-transferase CaiB-like acyl-CoA transferase [Chelatococcus asaccharovorans]CAH1682795.1 Crotonobetainyl-CoA:carnitine CoA-transferase CaiB-like acyl-CoA transferase [Chelatococcus asaccharovorans]
MNSVDKPLAGITVVELGHSVAAPYAGLILADLGARVIKVENPGSGDYARGWGPPFFQDTASAFHSLNRGKEGIAVDFADEAQADALRRLILTEADAVIQNLRPGILDKFGLTADLMRASKPELIWCDIGAFGATGPLASKPGYDPLAQASTGIMSVTGEGDRPPVRVGVSLIDMGSGMWAVIGLLAALVARRETGQGRLVSTSLFETGLAWMTVPLAGYEASGELRRPFGSGTAEIVPYQCFETSDGWLMVAAGNDSLYRKLCGALGLTALATDPDFATNTARVVNRERLIPQISAVTRTLSTDALGRTLDEAGVPNAPLLNVDQVSRHPQTQALAMTVRCSADDIDLMGVPLSFDGQRPRKRVRAPKLGEHNDILKIAKPETADAR